MQCTSHYGCRDSLGRHPPRERGFERKDSTFGPAGQGASSAPVAPAARDAHHLVGVLGQGEGANHGAGILPQAARPHPAPDALEGADRQRRLHRPHRLPLGPPNFRRPQVLVEKDQLSCLRDRAPGRGPILCPLDSARRVRFDGAMYAVPKPGFDPETMRAVALVYRRDLGRTKEAPGLACNPTTLLSHRRK